MRYRVRWGAEAAGGASTTVKRLVPFQAPLLGGGTFDAKPIAGHRPLVLVFWASWCAPCVAEAPHLQALYEEFSDRGVAFLAVSIDEPSTHETLRALVERLRLTYPVGLDADGAVLRRFVSGGSIPLTLVFDGAGRLVYQHGNYEPGDEDELERVLTSLSD